MKSNKTIEPRNITVQNLTDRKLGLVMATHASIVKKADQAYREYCSLNDIELDPFGEDEDLVGLPGQTLREVRKTKRVFDEELSRRTLARIRGTKMAAPKEAWEV